MFRERLDDALGIGICAAPFARFAPDGIHRAYALRLRFHDVQVMKDALLVRNGHAETADRYGGREFHPIS